MSTPASINRRTAWRLILTGPRSPTAWKNRRLPIGASKAASRRLRSPRLVCPSAYAALPCPSGTWSAAHYPASRPPAGGGPSSRRLARAALLAVAAAMVGYGWRQHLIPDWNPDAAWFAR